MKIVAISVNEATMGRVLRPSHESTMTVLDLALIRRAILTVIDDGCTCESEGHPWEFYESGTDVDGYTEDMANQNRLRFCDAIQNYIVDRIAPALKGNVG